MIDSYIIMNRKTDLIIKVFVFNICLIVILVIWGINTLNYQSYFQIHSKILNFNSYYLMEVLIPVKEINQVINKNKLLIGGKNYNYVVYEISDDIVYQDNINYRKLYLEVINLDEKYIIFEMYNENNNIIISITNIFDNTKNKDNIYKVGFSTKGGNHGYGLSLVKKLVNKNNLLKSYHEITDNEFTQVLEIKNP